ncbi:MAG: AAA family ATPase [Lachnospiraceae bacterium]|nr:AAA family ATPase [Lachnospiraceae bacterium]
MKTMLYIYNTEKRKLLQKKLRDFTFVSIAYFLEKSDTLPELDELLEEEGFDYFVIDISNLIKDGVYYKVFIERYLWKLCDSIENLHFCLREEYLQLFLEWFPYFFEDEEIEMVGRTDSSEKENTQVFDNKIILPMTLYAYRKSETIKSICETGKMIPFASLIEYYEGIILRYDMDYIKKWINDKKVEYIDISSVIKTIKVRNDLLFPFEVLLYRISLVKKIKFCIEKNLIQLVEELLPFTFSEEIDMDDYIEEVEKSEGSKFIPDIEKIGNIADAINQTLKGHDDFKKDFKQNLLKYSFLNNIGERKIFSIILCGESGVGKTEFGKIVSEKLYPKEPLIKINFGNYSNEGVLNSLIGSPLGYVGSEEGGELINKIETSKAKVILIDEFEKATPAVYNFFYELLEDGIFTDRHGIQHNLDSYIIIFTSNMTQLQYQKYIPDSLKSRFDMIYYFVDLPEKEKLEFIQNTAQTLITKLENQFGKRVSYEVIQLELEGLVGNRNLRDIKRKIENIVFHEFFKE